VKLLIKGGLITFGLLALFAWHQYDRNTNYVPISARVVKLEALCYLEKTERGVASKTTYTTKEGPCEIVELLQKSDPKFDGYHIVRNNYVEYYYTSPVDGQAHTGRHQQVKHKDGRLIAEGDELMVLAHKKNAEKTQRF